MKIVLFLNKDIQANLAYNLLKPELLKHDVRIYYTNAVGDSSKKPVALKLYEKYEKDFIYQDVKAFFTENNWQTDFEFLDEDFKSFPIGEAKAVNNVAFIEELKEFSPDLFISIRFGKIFKDEIISVPKHGLINLHSGILPDYKGILATLHALKNKAKFVGCTLHTIPDSDIDTGEIINIAQLPVNRNKSLFWHVNQLYPLGSKLILKAMQEISTGKTLKKQAQNLQEGAYFSVPTKKDFQELKAAGIAIFSKEEYIEFIISAIGKNLTNQQLHLLETWLSQKI